MKACFVFFCLESADLLGTRKDECGDHVGKDPFSRIPAVIVAAHPAESDLCRRITEGIERAEHDIMLFETARHVVVRCDEEKVRFIERVFDRGIDKEKGRSP